MLVDHKPITWRGFPLWHFLLLLAAQEGRATHLAVSSKRRRRRGPGWCFEGYSTMQSTMNVNVLGLHGSQENCNLDNNNTARKKGSLWYRRSLRGNRDRQRQNASTLPRVCKVRAARPTQVDMMQHYLRQSLPSTIMYYYCCCINNYTELNVHMYQIYLLYYTLPTS